MEIIHKIGRRKTSVARIYLSKGKDKMTINGKDFKDYFPTTSLQFKILQPFKLTNNIFQTYDKNINFKYNVEVNQKALSRIKNTL